MFICLLTSFCLYPGSDFMLQQVARVYYIVTCQAHPVLVKKTNQMCSSFLLNFLSRWLSCGVLVNSAGWRLPCRSGPPVDGPKYPWPVSCRCPSGLLETPPCWHAIIYISFYCIYGFYWLKLIKIALFYSFLSLSGVAIFMYAGPLEDPLLYMKQKCYHMMGSIEKLVNSPVTGTLLCALLDYWHQSNMLQSVETVIAGILFNKLIIFTKMEQ